MCAKANPDSFTCHKCNEHFTKLEYLQQHVQTHENIGQDKHCPHGGKSFISSTLPQIYLRTHTECKLFKCQHSGKSFCQSSILQVHLRTHTKDQLNKETPETPQNN